MSRTPDDTALPEALRPLFWDYRFGDLSWERHRDLVVARVLHSGTWDDMGWLRRTMGDEAMRAWLMVRRGAGLDARRLHFWALILDIPRRTVTRWLEDPARAVWDRRLDG